MQEKSSVSLNWSEVYCDSLCEKLGIASLEKLL